jgi:N6-adenosine-specific RNA methylase IME4
VTFRTLLIDPPWTYHTWSPKGNRAADKYETQSSRWIERLPVEDVMERTCTVLLWATNPLMPEAFRVLQAWGVEYKTALTWVKMSRAAAPRIGMGYHARACTEHLLVASRGNAGAPEVERRPPGVFFCPIGEHSAKPSFQYDIAEGYPGPYLELFSRPRDGGLFPARPGWTFLGDAVDGRDMREALRDLATCTGIQEMDMARGIGGKRGLGRCECKSQDPNHQAEGSDQIRLFEEQ